MEHGTNKFADINARMIFWRITCTLTQPTVDCHQTPFGWITGASIATWQQELVLLVGQFFGLPPGVMGGNADQRVDKRAARAGMGDMKKK
jgi:hypothetical protein